VSDALPCPRCGGASDLASWLDRAHARLVEAGCLRARCPRCDGDAHLALEAGGSAIGTLSPAPAMFRPERRVAQPELAVRRSLDGLLVSLGPRRWLFEA
jgi:hypothetical protein